MSSTLFNKKIQRIFYVYAHKRKHDNKIFYIGKGSGNRAMDNSPRNIIWERTVQKYNGFDYEIIYEDLLESEAFEIESQIISKIGLDNLCNITPGGSGGDTLSNNPNYLEIGRKISEKCKGELNPNFNMGFFRWWVEKYGIDTAEKMAIELKIKRSKLPRKKRIIKYQSWKDKLILVYGEMWESVYHEINDKIRQKALSRKKIECEFCGKLYSPHTIKRHQLSKNCSRYLNL